VDEWLRVNGSCPLCRKRINDDDANAANDVERTNSGEMLMVPQGASHASNVNPMTAR
jgi:hypothetical protein